MKKNHFIARKGLFSLALAAVGAMFLGSCAVMVLMTKRSLTTACLE